MPQFNMTPEDLSLTRKDVEEMLKKKPKNKPDKDHIKEELHGLRSKEFIDKIVSDLESY